jgi:hypothetical protein
MREMTRIAARLKFSRFKGKCVIWGAVLLSLLIVCAGLYWEFLIRNKCETQSKLVWPCHTIDDKGAGADGIRMMDVNGDGFLDITTAWEQSGEVKLYLSPSIGDVLRLWPSVSVGTVASAEDAVFVDLDADGRVDIVSATESMSKSLFVHWAPSSEFPYLSSKSWKTEVLGPASMGQKWMFSLPMDVDGRDGIDIITGSKNENAAIGWFQAPANPRAIKDWRWHPLYKAGWIMSLISHDMDLDGDLDILASDRRGERSGVLWLENPGPDESGKVWAEHRIGPVGKNETMFLALSDVDADGKTDVVAAVKGGPLLFFRRVVQSPLEWEMHEIKMPLNTGTGKSVAVGDIDGDGRNDIVVSTEAASGSLGGVKWLSYSVSPEERDWTTHELSGPAGAKFDLVHLMDVDSDGDLDVLTTEEKDGLGVVWYENPFGQVRTPGKIDLQ